MFHGLQVKKLWARLAHIRRLLRLKLANSSQGDHARVHHRREPVFSVAGSFGISIRLGYLFGLYRGTRIAVIGCLVLLIRNFARSSARSSAGLPAIRAWTLQVFRLNHKPKIAPPRAAPTAPEIVPINPDPGPARRAPKAAPITAPMPPNAIVADCLPFGSNGTAILGALIRPAHPSRCLAGEIGRRCLLSAAFLLWPPILFFSLTPARCGTLGINSTPAASSATSTVSIRPLL